MPRLIIPCTVCGKPLRLIKSIPYGANKEKALNRYECGHIFIEESDNTRIPLVLDSTTGDKHARPYQGEGVDFIANGHPRNEPFNCCIADQQRLGKTPQALLGLASAYKERTPCLIVVGGANLFQWTREYKTWASFSFTGIYPIIGSKSFIPPGFDAYIISRDTLSKGDRVEQLLKFGFKLVIVDEMHNFKNTNSQRSKALVNFLTEVSKTTENKIVHFTCFKCMNEWDQTIEVKSDNKQSTTTYRAHCMRCGATNAFSGHKENVTKRKCGLIMLTGTPIVNRADEYFPILNLLAPTKFPSRENFRTTWLVKDGAQYNRVKPWLLEEFRQTIEPYILRREKEDVYADCPPLDRLFTVVQVQDEHLKQAYNRVLDKMEEANDRGNYTFFDSLGELNQLRQICGMAKVEWVCEYVADLLDNDPDARIAIGLHHHSIRDTLKYKLKEYGVLTLDGTDTNEAKDRTMRNFKTSNERVLLLGMVAAKEGLEFYYLPQAVAMERMWSSSMEEQFEYRFYNPDKEFLEKNGVDPNKITMIEYPICVGTVDEFFYDLVEDKRKIFGDTVGTNWNIENDKDSFKQLMDRTLKGRL